MGGFFIREEGIRLLIFFRIEPLRVLLCISCIFMREISLLTDLNIVIKQRLLVSGTDRSVIFSINYS